MKSTDKKKTSAKSGAKPAFVAPKLIRNKIMDIMRTHAHKEQGTLRDIIDRTCGCGEGY